MILVLMPLLLFAACSGVQSRRTVFIRDHPGTDVAVKNAILGGEVLSRMSKEEVRASWGEPDSEVTTREGNGRELSRWSYRKRYGKYSTVYEVRFVDGIVQDMESIGYRDASTGRRYYAPNLDRTRPHR
jgi:hypothetical protein